MDESERLAAVTNGSVDLARISLNKEETATLEQTNGGSLSGDKIITELVGDNSYYYFGINASLMKVGTDSNSEQSLALRKAFATLLAFDPLQTWASSITEPRSCHRLLLHDGELGGREP